MTDHGSDVHSLSSWEIDPLTPGAFCQKCIFWTFLDILVVFRLEISFNLVEKAPLASWFTTFWLGFSIFEFFSPFLFTAFIGLLLGLLAVKKTSKKVSWRWAIFTRCSGRKFCSEFLTFWAFYVPISGSIRPITLIWASLERSFLPAEVEYRWCQFGSKVMTSAVEERPGLFTAGYGLHRSQRVKAWKKFRLEPDINLWPL